ncbi:MAG: peptidoglycan DD-metalloendopeptidase family protein [Erysipelotrichaceae bacterium]
MKRRTFVLILTCFLILGFSPVENINAATYDFNPGNEAYYYNLCSSHVSAANRPVCLAFQQYINNKALNAQKQLEAIKKDMKNIAANISKYAAQIANYNAQVIQLEADIASLEASITESEGTIAKLEVQIVDRTKVVDAIDAKVKERMVNMQSFASLNGYIDFIMGAKDFTDLIRRVEGINDITKYDKTQMEMLNEQIRLLNEDKAEVVRQKEALQSNKANVETNKTTVLGLKATTALILAEFQKQEAALEAMENQVAADLSASQAALKAISKALNAILPSPGWSSPIRDSFRVSSGTWYYPGTSSTHLGADLAASVGTNLYAVANGVVLYSADACPTYGYLGNKCGYPASAFGGNQVYLMVNVNNRSYAIRYLHLQAGTPEKMGTIVRPGDVIGRVGSSGNSSGPHLHIEIIYLGTNTVAYYANRWRGDLAFGAGWTLANRCDYNGNSAPCRMRPENVFGITYGGRYN